MVPYLHQFPAVMKKMPFFGANWDKFAYLMHILVGLAPIHPLHVILVHSSYTFIKILV